MHGWGGGLGMIHAFIECGRRSWSGICSLLLFHSIPLALHRHSGGCATWHSDSDAPVTWMSDLLVCYPPPRSLSVPPARLARALVITCSGLLHSEKKQNRCVMVTWYAWYVWRVRIQIFQVSPVILLPKSGNRRALSGVVAGREA